MDINVLQGIGFVIGAIGIGLAQALGAKKVTEYKNSNEEVISAITGENAKSDSEIIKKLEKNDSNNENRLISVNKKLDEITEKQVKQGYLIQELKQFKLAIDNNTQAMNGLKEALVHQRAFYEKLEYMLQEQRQEIKEINKKIP